MLVSSQEMFIFMNRKQPKTTAPEQSAEYKALIAEYYDNFAPATSDERGIIDTLVSSELECRDLDRLGIAILENHITANGSETGENSLCAVYCRAFKDLEGLGDKLCIAHKSYITALTKLMLAQAGRAKKAASNPAGLYSVPVIH